MALATLRDATQRFNDELRERGLRALLGGAVERLVDADVLEAVRKEWLQQVARNTEPQAELGAELQAHAI